MTPVAGKSFLRNPITNIIGNQLPEDASNPAHEFIPKVNFLHKFSISYAWCGEGNDEFTFLFLLHAWSYLHQFRHAGVITSTNTINLKTGGKSQLVKSLDHEDCPNEGYKEENLWDYRLEQSKE